MDDIVLTVNDDAQGILTALLAFIMFSVAIGLDMAAFKKVLGNLKAVLVGLVSQLIVLPLLTLLLIFMWQPTPSMALGMIVVASCPGGNVSNYFTTLSRGDVALSVTLTSLVSVLAVFMTPMAILFWAGLNSETSQLLTEIEIDGAAFLIKTMTILALPLLAGMVFAANYKDLALRLAPKLRFFSFFILIFFIVAMTVNNSDVLLDFGLVIIPLVIVHNAMALFAGNFMGRAFGLSIPARRAITFETGIQNSGLGLVILLSQFQGLGGAAIITAAWGLWHIVSGILLSYYYRGCDHRKGTTHV